MKFVFGFVLALLAAVPVSAVAQQQQQQPIEFRLATGGETGNYYASGSYVARDTKGVRVKVQTSTGSEATLDAIVRGDVDGGFVQADALNAYVQRNRSAATAVRRTGSLYREYAHLLCNTKLGAKHMRDLPDGTRIGIGAPGSGHNVTWNALIAASKSGWFKGKKYDKLVAIESNDYLDLQAASMGKELQCVFYVASFGAPWMTRDAAEFPNLRLVGTDDKDFADAKDSSGEPLYSFTEIPAGTYPKSNPEGTLFGTKSVNVIGIDALFVVGSKWANDNRDALIRVSRGFNAALPDIKKLVKQ